MNRAKVFIVFTCLLAFVVGASAKPPKIVWKNLKEKYDRFEDVMPTVLNEGNSSVFMPRSFSSAIEYGHIALLKFDEKQDKWTRNYIWICGTLTKQERKYISQNLTAYKLDSNVERQFKLDKLDWFSLTKSYFDVGFTELSDYNGTGKYRIQIPFSTDSQKIFVSESPEFEVIERDFEK